MKRELNKIFDVQSREARRDILDKFDLSVDDKNKVLSKIANANNSSAGDNFIMSGYYIKFYINSPLSPIICDIVNDVVMINADNSMPSDNVIILKNDGDEYIMQNDFGTYAKLLTFTKTNNGLTVKMHTDSGLYPSSGENMLYVYSDSNMPEITGEWSLYDGANNNWIIDNFGGCRISYITIFNKNKYLLPGKVVCTSPHNTKFTLEIIE